MSEQFTPGPWAVDTDLDVSIDITDEDNGRIASGWKTVASETHAGFASVVVDMNYTNQWDDALLNANAALIAAAPDMYAALKWFIDDIDSTHTVMVDFDTNVDRARAALAKASPSARMLECEK